MLTLARLSSDHCRNFFLTSNKVRPSNLTVSILGTLYPQALPVAVRIIAYNGARLNYPPVARRSSAVTLTGRRAAGASMSGRKQQGGRPLLPRNTCGRPNLARLRDRVVPRVTLPFRQCAVRFRRARWSRPPSVALPMRALASVPIEGRRRLFWPDAKATAAQHLDKLIHAHGYV